MKKKSHSSTPMKLTPAEAAALSCALDFLAHCDSYTYDTAKFDHNDAIKAAWNIDGNQFTGKRRELRAVIAAIDLVIHSIQNASPELEQVSSVFPDLIPVLKDSLPLLEILRPRLAAHAAK